MTWLHEDTNSLVEISKVVTAAIPCSCICIIGKASSVILQALSRRLSMKIGLWPAPPAYDETGRWALADDATLSFSCWANDFNQREIFRRAKGGGDLANNPRVFVDASIPQAILEELFPIQLLESESPGNIWPFALPRIHMVHWFGTKYDPDADWFVFLFESALEAAANDVYKECNNIGHPCIKLEIKGDGNSNVSG